MVHDELAQQQTRIAELEAERESYCYRKTPKNQFMMLWQNGEII